jgi:hypothetical protein
VDQDERGSSEGNRSVSKIEAALQQRSRLITGAILTGGSITLLGKPVRLHIEWLDGYPDGMDEAAVRKFGIDLLEHALNDTPNKTRPAV